MRGELREDAGPKDMIESADAVHTSNNDLWVLVRHGPEKMDKGVRPRSIAQAKVRRCGSCSELRLELPGESLPDKTAEGAPGGDAADFLGCRRAACRRAS